MDGECYCARGFGGVACAELEAPSSEPPCPLDCRGHGKCVQGVCMCDDGFEGATCLRALGPMGVPVDVRLQELEERRELRRQARGRWS